MHPLFWLLLACVFNVSAATRIVTLSPHLTEWVYSLEQEQNLVGVSAFSDYPAQAKALPIVADFNGIDFNALLRLQPDLVLVWEGGNKPQDIARLTTLGIKVFRSSPHTPTDIGNELEALATELNVAEKGLHINQTFQRQLKQLSTQYGAKKSLNVFYYMSTTPLMTVGQHAWANQVLDYCGGETIFADSPVDYPQVTLQQVLLRQPDILIGATSLPKAQQEAFWSGHRNVLSSPLLVANPDHLHRFTLRLMPTLISLCEQIDQYREQ